MKRVLLALVALPVAVASPTAAQYNTNYPSQYANQSNVNLSARIDQLRVRLQAGVQNGLITRSEARPIREQIRQLDQVERQYAVNGLSWQERADLQQRIRIVRQQLRVADNGSNGRYAQWDVEDGYNNQGYQPGYGQGYQQGYGQGYPPYQPGYGQPAQQGGVAGILNGILGTGGLQIGQRVPASLYAVPYQYQAQYRDGNGIYYRSDGRRIYQIDARNQTVIRVFSM